MAQPSNTFDSYDQVGIREDLSDIISNITPESTPYFSKCGKTTANNTLVEWQTDTLRNSGANAHIEGDATTAQAAVQKMFGITEYLFECLPKPSPAFRSSLVIPRVIRMGFPHV